MKYGDFQDKFIYEEFAKKPQDRLIKCSELLRDEANVVWKKFAKMDDRARY